MEAAFCVETLEDALACHGKPDIFNTDQGSQGGLKWWSQHSGEGGCDEDSTTAFGPGWSGAIAVTRSALGGRTR
jgi:hypothetical protein